MHTVLVPSCHACENSNSPQPTSLISGTPAHSTCGTRQRVSAVCHMLFTHMTQQALVRTPTDAQTK